jgi:hypothetical protein
MNAAALARGSRFAVGLLKENKPECGMVIQQAGH